MTGTNTTQGVLGATTTAAGIAILPSTSGNVWLTIFSLVTISVGALVITSFVVSKLVQRFSR